MSLLPYCPARLSWEWIHDECVLALMAAKSYYMPRSGRNHKALTTTYNMRKEQDNVEHL